MPDTPKRIQLRRTKGWRLPENTVKVDRTTKWGRDLPATLARQIGLRVVKMYVPRDAP